MLVPEFCENSVGNFAEEFYMTLPEYCVDCGYPMEMSETLTQLHCSNVRCPSKIIQRLVAIANALGVKDFGEARARRFVETWGITNPLFIFGFEPEVDGQLAPDISMDVSMKIANQFAQRKRFTLGEYIKVANLPFIQMSAFSIFDGFDDLESAYLAIEDGGVEYIRDRLDIKDNGTEDISIRALKVYESLMTFKDDLLECVGYVDIIKVNVPEMTSIKAVCSTEVGVGFRTKADFYATCNNMYNNLHIEFGNSVTKNTDYLVWAGADGTPAQVTNKVKKAKAYQDKGINIKIVTALEFIGILETLAKKGR